MSLFTKPKPEPSLDDKLAASQSKADSALSLFSQAADELDAAAQEQHEVAVAALEAAAKFNSLHNAAQEAADKATTASTQIRQQFGVWT